MLSVRHESQVRPQLSAASPTNGPQPKVIAIVIIKLMLWSTTGCEAKVLKLPSFMQLGQGHNAAMTAALPREIKTSNLDLIRLDYHSWLLLSTPGQIEYHCNHTLIPEVYVNELDVYKTLTHLHHIDYCKELLRCNSRFFFHSSYSKMSAS